MDALTLLRNYLDDPAIIMSRANVEMVIAELVAERERVVTLERALLEMRETASRYRARLANVAKLREALEKAETALSWALIEGLDECVPRTMEPEYQYAVAAHEYAKSVLKETKGDGDE